MTVTKVRLLVCRDCRTVEDLADYHGNPDYDDQLNYLTSKHVYPNGERHFGHLMDVESKWWEMPSARKQILEEMGLTTGLGSETYAHIETFKEDAAKCYSQHHRPKGGCIDWKDDRKRIGNPTPEIAKNWRDHPFKVYLCDYCPVSRYVEMRENDILGLYEEGN